MPDDTRTGRPTARDAIRLAALHRQQGNDSLATAAGDAVSALMQPNEAAIVRIAAGELAAAIATVIAAGRRPSPTDSVTIRSRAAGIAAAGTGIEDVGLLVGTATRAAVRGVLDVVHQMPGVDDALLDAVHDELLSVALACVAVGTAGAAEAEPSTQQWTAAMNEITAGGLADGAMSRKQATALGIDRRRRYGVVLVASTTSRPGHLDVISALAELVARASPQRVPPMGARNAPTPHAAAFVPASDLTVMKSHGGVAAETGALMIVTPPARSMVELLDAYANAAETAMVASRIGVRPGCIAPHDLAALTLLARTDAAAAQELATTTLAAILNDTSNRSDRALAVLRATLATDGTPEAVAAYLGKTTKVVLYRYATIADLTGLDTLKLDDRLLLQMATLLYFVHCNASVTRSAGGSAPAHTE